MSERVAAPWANELRRAGFRDERVISAMDLPRDIFAPRGFGGWNSAALPIGHGQTISHPLTVAQMTSLLIEKNPRKVLEIGTGSGFQAAVLSMLCDEVCTVERIQALQSEAIFRFNRLEIYNIKTRYSHGTLGWPDEAPFDAIIVTACAQERPDALLAQLGPDGRLVTPLAAPDGKQYLKVYDHKGSGSDFTERTVREVRFVPLVAGNPE